MGNVAQNYLARLRRFSSLEMPVACERLKQSQVAKLRGCIDVFASMTNIGHSLAIRDSGKRLLRKSSLYFLNHGRFAQRSGLIRLKIWNKSVDPTRSPLFTLRSRQFFPAKKLPIPRRSNHPGAPLYHTTSPIAMRMKQTTNAINVAV